MGSYEHKKIEILAPAGSVESMKAAFHAGADAVYMGGSRFGAGAVWLLELGRLQSGVPTWDSGGGSHEGGFINRIVVWCGFHPWSRIL